MPVKKLSGWKKTLRLNDLMYEVRAKHFERRWSVRLGVIVLLMVGVYAVTNRAAHDAPAPADAATSVETTAPAAKTVAAKPAAKPVAGKSASTAPASRVAASAPAARSAAKPADKPADKPVLAKADTSAAKAETVTLTGCLEQDDETFRLKDTDGDDAPKSRSWKTGFLTKRKATIELAAAGDALQRYAGQRIKVTGVLVNREMQVLSLQRVAASCAGN